MESFTYKLFTEPGCKVTKQLLALLSKENINGAMIDLTSKEANSDPQSFKILNIPTLIIYNEKKEVVDHIFSIEDLKIFMNKK